MKYQLSVAVLLLTCPVTFAQVVIQPPDLNPGDPYRLLFLTSTSRDGTSSSSSDYNNFVNQVADNSGNVSLAAIDWRAIVSTGLTAIEITDSDPSENIGVPFYRLDGVRVADDAADLWDGSLIAPIAVTELGDSSTSSPTVHTGTNRFGTIDGLSTCLCASNPSSGAYIGIVATGLDPHTWVEFADGSGSNGTERVSQQRFYAMSPILTATIPEPTSVLLLGLASLALAARRLERLH